MTDLLWPRALRARVLPRRTHGHRGRARKSGRPVFDALYKSRRNAIVAGFPLAPDDLRVRQEKAIAYLDGAPTGDAIDAAAAAMLLHADYPRGKRMIDAELTDAIVDMWIAENGAAFAVEACVRTTSLTARYQQMGDALALTPLALTTDRDRTLENRWIVLRERLAKMSDEEYASARAAAEALLENASPRVALRLAYAFPDEAAWSASLARRLIDSDQKIALSILLLSLSDQAPVDEAIAFLGPAIESLGEAVALSLIDALGAGAQDAVLAIADACAKSHLADERKEIYAALAIIPSANIARWFAEHLEQKAIRAIALAYLPQVPDHARTTLEPLTQRRKPNEVAAVLLRSLERAGESHDGREAAASELPPVLANLRAKPKKLPPWLNVPSLPRPVLRDSKKLLPLAATQTVIEMLAADEPLDEIRQACDAGDFAWAIFEAWATANHPPSQKWAFFAIGHFGTDAHAHRLAALIRTWPTEGAFGRAVLGLDVLAT